MISFTFTFTAFSFFSTPCKCNRRTSALATHNTMTSGTVERTNEQLQLTVLQNRLTVGYLHTQHLYFIHCMYVCTSTVETQLKTTSVIGPISHNPGNSCTQFIYTHTTSSSHVLRPLRLVPSAVSIARVYSKYTHVCMYTSTHCVFSLFMHLSLSCSHGCMCQRECVCARTCCVLCHTYEWLPYRGSSSSKISQPHCASKHSM